MTTRKEKEQKLVNKGAALLDKILPGWYSMVNLEKLNMGEGSLCMMGQLFGTSVESKLARKMYPEEMKAVRSAQGYKRAAGFTIAMHTPVADKETLIDLLIEKCDLSKTAEERQALFHVCAGHDTRCEWASAIAERKARDATAVKAETQEATPSASPST